MAAKGGYDMQIKLLTIGNSGECVWAERGTGPWRLSLEGQGESVAESCRVWKSALHAVLFSSALPSASASEDP